MNNVYFTGRASLPNQGIQMMTMKLAAGTGNIQWSDYYGMAAGQDDIGWDIAISPAGNPVICGVSLDSEANAYGITRKLDASDGTPLWTDTTPGAQNDLVSRNGWLAILDGGDIATCHRGYGANSYDVILERHDQGDGHATWSTVYDGPTHGGDNPRDMIQDDAGNLLVTGVQDSFWNYNYMLLKFDGTDGSLTWTAPNYDGPPGWYDVANCVAIGSGGVIIITGLSDGSGTGWDIATVGYDPANGSQLWVTRFDGGASQSDEGRDMVVDDLGDIYITGYGYENNTGKDHLTLSYLYQSGSPVLPPAASILLEPAYPNPFNPSTTIAFTLDHAQAISLDIYGLDGRRVKELHRGTTPSGHHTVRWDGRDEQGLPQPSGVYIYALESGSDRQTGRVVLIK